MVRRGKKRRMFPGGNTASGFHSFFDYIIDKNYNKKYIIKGGPGSGKSTLMDKIGEYMQGMGYDITEFHCSTDPDSLDAMAIPELGVVLLDGMAPHAMEPKNIGITDHIIWLGEYCDNKKLEDSKEEITALNQRADSLFKMGFSYLREAKESYSRWGYLGKNALVLEEYNSLITKVSKKLFKDRPWKGLGEGLDTHFFASAISGKGYYSYIDELIKPGYHIYGFAGMPGSGAQRAIRELALRAKKMGLKTESFHCPIDTEKLDMVIVPELKSLVIYVDQVSRSSRPLFDYSNIDTYINFDDYLDQNLLLEYRSDIEKSIKHFNSSIDVALDYIAKARHTHGKLEKHYADAMDFKGIDLKMEEVLREIIALVFKRV